jgi:hypothetical protein
MIQNQRKDCNWNGASGSSPKHSKKTRVASFNRSNITVTMKMVSLFDRDVGEYKEPSPRISLIVNGKYNRIAADPGLLKDLGSFLTTLGDAMESMGVREEIPSRDLIKERIGKLVPGSETSSEMLS